MLCLCKDINWESNTTDVRSLFVTSVIQKTTEGGHGGRKADLCEFGDSLVIKQVLGQPNSETLSLKTKQTQKTKKMKAIKGRSEITYSKSLTMLHSPIMALLGIAHYIERFQNVYATISHRRGGLAAPLKKAYGICLKPWRTVNRKTQVRSRKSL